MYQYQNQAVVAWLYDACQSLHAHSYLLNIFLTSDNPTQRIVGAKHRIYKNKVRQSQFAACVAAATVKAKVEGQEHQERPHSLLDAIW